MATRTIRAEDREGKTYSFERPEQMVGYDFKLVEVDKNDWTQDQIRTWIRPTLSKYGGELRER